MSKSLVLIIGVLISQISGAQQGSAKAYVSLSPAGDFVATMKSTGSAQVVGSKVSAKNIIIDLKSMTTGLDLRDDHAKNKYMEVSKYPEAILIEATGENGKGQGKLKFHGKEGHVTGTYKIEGGKTLTAEFNIKLSEFGITEISYKGIGVDDSVKIEVQVPVLVAAAPVAPAAPAAKKAIPPQPPKKK
jgi:hypothetical protein